MNTLSVAASTWTFRHYSLLKALDVIHLLGVTEVELWAEGVHMDPRGDMPDVEEVGSALDRLGLWPVAMHAPFRGMTLLEGEKSSAVSVLRHTMDVAAALDCALLVVHVDGEGEGQIPAKGTAARKDVLQNAVNALRPLCDYAAQLGITLLLENQPDRSGARIGSSVDELIQLIADVDAPNLRLCFDVAHAVVSTGDWQREWQKAAELVMSVHMSDTHGTEDEHLPLGVGAIDWQRLVQAVAKADPRPGVVLEVQGGEDAVQRSLKQLALFGVQ